MKERIRLIFVFIGIICFTILFCETINNIAPAPNDFLKAISLKENRARKIQEPKLIFNGGSNVAFNIDSKLIENQLNYPTVNLGVMSGLKFELMANQTKALANKGDVVVFILEYFLYLSPESEGTNQTILSALELNPSISEYLKDQQNPLYLYAFRTQSSVRRIIERLDPNNDTTIYKLSSFNKNGDISNNNGNYFTEKDISSINDLNFDNKNIKRINFQNFLNIAKDLDDFAKSKGFKVYYSYPSIINDQKKINQAKSFDRILRKTGINIIGTPQEFIFTEECFFNSMYHLNTKGKRINTLKVINLLRNEIISGNVKKK